MVRIAAFLLLMKKEDSRPDRKQSCIKLKKDVKKWIVGKESDAENKDF